VFGYSDEDGTAAADLDGKLGPDVIADRVERITALAEEISGQRAEDRIGTVVTVLVDEIDEDGVWGRGEHQAPEVDGATRLLDADGVAFGSLVRAEVVGAQGIDLVARALEVLSPDRAAGDLPALDVVR
jgi:ribosomal protein S12 methylthiotransferase